MKFLPKLRLTLLLPFFLLAFLPVVVAVVVNWQQRQSLSGRAFSSTDFWKTVRENGVLIGAGTSPATTDEGGLSEQGVVLPTVSGFGSDLFTGAAAVAYGLSTPAGPAGLGPSLSFNYSSNIVSDLRFGLDDNERRQFIRQGSIIGWGFDIGGLGSIVREDRREHADGGPQFADTSADVFYLNFSGGGFRLFRQADGSYETNPKSFLKIEHRLSYEGGGKAFDMAEWVITGRDGTKYYFGSPLDEEQLPQGANLTYGGGLDYPDNPETHPANLFNIKNFCQWLEGRTGVICQSTLVGSQWLLRKVVDVHGNELEIKYWDEQKDVTNGIFPWTGANPAGFTLRYLRASNPWRIRWGKNEPAGDLDFDYELQFEYEERPDWQVDGWDANGSQPLFTQKRLEEVKLLSLGEVIKRWELGYEQGDRGNQGDGEGHSLLTSVQEYGSEADKGLPKQEYEYGGMFNETRLKEAENGYGGKVHYDYEELGTITVRNANDQGDTLNNRFNRLRVKSRRIEDGVGNFYTVTYEYFEPIAFAEQLASYPCETPFEPKPGESCDPNVYEFVPPRGFEFLGHQRVRTRLGSIGDIGEIKEIRESEYYQALAGESCFRIDPRRGQARLSRLLADGGQVWQETRSEFGVFGESGEVGQCNQIALPQDNASYQVRHKTTLTGLEVWRGSGARWTKSESLRYDEFGNLLKSVNYGEVDREGRDLEGEDNHYNYYNFYNDYKNSDGRHFVGLLRESFVSDRDFAVERVPNEIKKNWTEAAYDGRDFGQGVGERGLATASRTRVRGSDFEKAMVSRFEYDGFGNQTAVIDPLGRRTETVYDGRFHKLPKVVRNALGQEVATTYDYEAAGMGARGLPVTVVDGNGSETKFAYDSFGRTRVIARPGERPTPVIIGGMDNNPDTIYTYFEPDGEFSFSNITASGQARFAVLTAKKIDKDQYVKSLSFYNGLGQLVQTQQLGVPVGAGEDLNDFVSSQIYDSLGRVVFSSRPFRMAPATVANGQESPFVSGAGSRPESASLDQRFIVSHSQYDLLGRVTESFNFGMFNADWPASEDDIFPEDIIAATHVKTDYNGWRTTSFDPNYVSDPGQYAANRRVSVVDGFGRAREVREYNSNISKSVTSVNQNEEEIVSSYQYDVLGNLIKAIGPAGNETTVVYDSVGRREKMTDPDLGTVEFEYDENGNLIRQVQEAGPAATAEVKEVSFVYDQLNRLLEKKYGEEKVAGYIYDSGCEKGVGRLCRSEFNGGSEQYDYDERGRMSREIREYQGDSGGRFETGYRYLSNGSLAAVTYPRDGEVVNYEYDAGGRLKKVSGANEYVSRAVYDEKGRLEVFESGNGVETAYHFEEGTERVAGISHAKFGQEALARFAYQYDPAGNIVEWDDFPFPGRSFEYDSLHRLTAGAGGFEMEDRYEYDVLSRMGYKKEGTEELKMGYDNEQPLHAVARLNEAGAVKSESGSMTQAPGIDFNYDSAGNLLKDDRREFVWNVENYPTEISLFAQADSALELVHGQNWRIWPNDLRQYTAKSFLEYVQGFCPDVYQIQKVSDGAAYVRSVGGSDFVLQPGKAYMIVKGLPGYCAVQPESDKEIKVNFAYDASNRRFLKSVNDGSSTLYVNDYLEKTTTADGVIEWTKYYFAFGKRVALRTTTE